MREIGFLGIHGIESTLMILLVLGLLAQAADPAEAARLKAENGFLDEAIEICTKALEKGPESAAVLRARASVRLLKGQTAGAKEDAEAALALEPESSAGRVEIGRAHV